MAAKRTGIEPTKKATKEPSRAARKAGEASAPAFGDAEKLRAFRAARQSMAGGLRGESAEQVIEATGWIRTVGGANPYLTLRDRAGLTREAVDRALAEGRIQELPSLRGCTYLLPASDFALGLRAGGDPEDDAEIAMAKKSLGVTDREIDRLCDAVLRSLAKSSLDPAALREAVGGAARSLGEAGKKRGVTTTLPLALGKLQAMGEIRRVPVSGRLDQQRYTYARWTPNPRNGATLSDDELGRELAKRFFRWGPGGTVAELAAWTGFGKRAAQAAVEALGLLPLGEGSDGLLFPHDEEAFERFEAPEKPCLSFVSCLDNAVHLHRDAGPLVESEDANHRLLRGGKGTGGRLADLEHNLILDRGRLIGVWDWDAQENRVALGTFQKPPKGLPEERAKLAAYVHDQLGDVRTFSLDSPESRKKRLGALTG